MRKDDFMAPSDSRGREVIDVEYEEVGSELGHVVDSIRVVLIAFLIDCSISMKSILPELPGYLSGFVEEAKKDKQLYDEAEVLLGTFSTDYKFGNFEPLSQFRVPEYFDQEVEYTNMAEALIELHRIVRKRIHFYHSEVLKELPAPIVTVWTDGKSTSTREKMLEMKSVFDNYKRSNGKRKIELMAITTSKEAYAEMKELGYADFGILVSDKTKMADKMKKVACLASSISHSVVVPEETTIDDYFTRDMLNGNTY